MNTAVSAADPIVALEKILPPKSSLTIAGEEVAIRQIKVGMLPEVLRAVGPLQGILMNKGVKLDIPSLFMIHAEDCLALLSVLSQKPRTWVDDLELDDAINLFTALLEVNLDFFVRRVLPLLSGRVASLTETVKALSVARGQTQSKS